MTGLLAPGGGLDRADRAGPAEFVAPELADADFGDRGGDDGGGETDGLSGLGDTAAEPLVVGDFIAERFEAADGGEGLAGQGHGGAETVLPAEGAGQEFVMQDGLDPSGNPILGDIGPWFCKKVKKALGQPKLTVFLTSDKTKEFTNPFHIESEGKVVPAAELNLDGAASGDDNP